MTQSITSMQQRVEQLRQALGVQVCSLYFAHADQQSLEIIATSGLNPRAVGTRLTWQQGLTGRVARTGMPVAARDVQTHADYFHVDGSDEEQFKSYLGIPLKDQSELYGVLVIQTTEKRTFFQKDIHELYCAGQDLIVQLGERCLSA